MRVRLIFRLMIILMALKVQNNLYAQDTNLDYVKEYSKELEPGKDRIISAINYFKQKTGIDIYVASAYGYNQKGIFEYAEEWPNNKEGRNGILIAINTLATNEWDKNLKIKYTENVLTAISAERMEFVRKTVFVPLLNEQTVYLKNEINKGELSLSGKARYYMSIEAGINELLADTSQTEEATNLYVTYNNKTYYDKSKIKLKVTSNEELILSGFKDLKLVKWELRDTKGGSLTNSKKVSGSDRFTINSLNCPTSFTVYATDGKSNLEVEVENILLFSVKQSSSETVNGDASFAGGHGGLIVFYPKHNMDDIEGLTYEISTQEDKEIITYSASETALTWNTYNENTGYAYADGDKHIQIKLLDKQKIVIASSSHVVTVLPKPKLLSIIAEDRITFKRDGNENIRKAYDNETLYLVRENASDKQEAEVRIGTNGSPYYHDEQPRWRGHMGKEYSKELEDTGKEIVTFEHHPSYITDVVSYEEALISASAFGEKKQVKVKVVQKNEISIEMPGQLKTTLGYAKKLTAWSDTINRKLSIDKNSRFKFSVDIKPTFLSYTAEKPNSPDLTTSVKGTVDGSIKFSGKIPYPPLSGSFPPSWTGMDPLALWEVYAEAGIEFKAGVALAIKNEYSPTKYEFLGSGNLKGYLKVGASTLSYLGDYSIVGDLGAEVNVNLKLENKPANNNNVYATLTVGQTVLAGSIVLKNESTGKVEWEQKVNWKPYDGAQIGEPYLLFESPF